MAVTLDIVMNNMEEAVTHEKVRVVELFSLMTLIYKYVNLVATISRSLFSQGEQGYGDGKSGHAYVRASTCTGWRCSPRRVKRTRLFVADHFNRYSQI
jgi:hypothetical protein